MLLRAAKKHACLRENTNLLSAHYTTVNMPFRKRPRKGMAPGFFVAFDYSSDALSEIDAFFRKSGKVIVPLTVKDILEEQLAKKLA